MIELLIGILLMTFLGSCGAINFKMGARDVDGIQSFLINPYIVLGAGLYGASAIIDIILLRHYDYSLILPLTSITYVWTVLISYIIMKESINFKKSLGIILIILGCFFISLR